MMRAGKTLKEGLIELGFPKENKLIADTGIFELEARKAGIAKDLGIPISMELSNEDIFAAYEVSGADYFVSPDHIILATDDNRLAGEKIKKIKENLVKLVEVVPASKVIGVLQGVQPERIEHLFDFYRSQGLDIFAIGGLIPLFRHDKHLFEKVLRYSRDLLDGYWLHAFGLPIVKLIPFYLGDVGLDSVDTSMLLYLTAQRRYLVGVDARPVRLADFRRCSCSGCLRLAEGLHPQSEDFFVHLYIHNLIETSKIAENCG